REYERERARERKRERERERERERARKRGRRRERKRGIELEELASKCNTHVMTSKLSDTDHWRPNLLPKSLTDVDRHLTEKTLTQECLVMLRKKLSSQNGVS